MICIGKLANKVQQYSSFNKLFIMSKSTKNRILYCKKAQ